MKYFLAWMFFSCSTLLANEPEGFRIISLEASLIARNDVLSHIDTRLGYLSTAIEFFEENNLFDEDYQYYSDLMDEYEKMYVLLDDSK